MPLTAHESFETELILAHGRICTDNDDDLCTLMDAWSTVADEYDRLKAAARAVVEGSGYGVTATSWTGRNEHFTAVPQRLFDALRAALESPE